MNYENKMVSGVTNSDLLFLTTSPSKFWEDVKGIKEHAFSFCSKLKVLHIPYCVNKVEKSFCKLNNGLQVVSFNDRLTKIPEYSFAACYNLKAVKNIEKVKEIEDKAFYECHSLKEIDISNVTKLGEAVFYECENLDSIITNSKITEIKDRTFMNCSKLKTVILSPKLTKIGTGAFKNCERLNTINIPGTIEEIGNAAFENCKSLEYVKLGQNIKKVGSFAFENCEGLEGVYIPKTIKKIGPGAFKIKNIKYAYKLNNDDVILSRKQLENKDIAIECKYEDIYVYLNNFIQYEVEEVKEKLKRPLKVR